MAYNKKYVPQNLRKKVFERDNYTCVYCGVQACEELLQIDHVIPRCMGGSNNINNLVTACKKCNNRKNGRMPKIGDVEKLASVLGTSVEYLMGFQDGKPVITQIIEGIPAPTPEDFYNTAKNFPNMAYWGGVVDNARSVAFRRDEEEISEVSRMLELALYTLKKIDDLLNITKPSKPQQGKQDIPYSNVSAYNGHNSQYYNNTLNANAVMA